MKILVTGANGFIGKNLCVMLKERGFNDLYEITRETPKTAFCNYIRSADFIFHLAGINRPQDDKDFLDNYNLTTFIINELIEADKNTPILFSSSTQASIDNPYGKSKLKAEREILSYQKKSNALCYIYRLPNVFGKWSKPDYNSFVATFCNNAINDIPLKINDPSSEIDLVYIDDVCDEFISILDGSHDAGMKTVKKVYKSTVGNIANQIMEFKKGRSSLIMENVGDGLCRGLYSTYLSFYKPEHFSYSIPSHEDERGVFCEMLKTKNAGQFSFFTAKKGVTRGGHYHHTKNEKFLVLKGTALFRFENIVNGERHQLEASSSSFEIIQTIPGWSHDIKNIGEEELIVMLWANEIFDRDNPDTIPTPLFD